MGRPYAEELETLPETYLWAIEAPIDFLSAAVGSAFSLSLFAIGSGGSFTTAEFAAAVHRHYTSTFASALTPLEAVATQQSLRTAAILLVSASGRNPDVLGAFRRLAEREPQRLSVLCASTRSPLFKLAEHYPYVSVAEFDLPHGKDGFLATNSLLASCILLTRTYAAICDREHSLPRSFRALIGDEVGDQPLEGIRRLCEPLWRRSTLIVLYGPSTRPAAIDLESKFSEAALGPTQLADYRNFAHGRHHWLAKRGEETGVLSIISEDDRELAERTLAMIPEGIPVVKINTASSGPAACLAAIGQVLLVVGAAGIARRIDPGDPGVPMFGRKLYHMRAFELDNSQSGVSHSEIVAIERKSATTASTLIVQGRLEQWRAAYRSFVERITRAEFLGLVFDYDGTLCDEAHRFEPLSPVIARELNRLLDAEVVVGIATGRGKSVKEALRGAINRAMWPQVVVGYYNGGDVGLLNDDSRPDRSDVVDEPLAGVADALRNDARLMALAIMTFRRTQLTIEPRSKTYAEELWALVQHRVYALDLPGVAVLRSSHSMDVVAPGTSKRKVVERVDELVGSHGKDRILCVGDRGRWPGNDFSLLSGRYSLSVDQVSPDPESCWNLAIPGTRGMDVTLYYLQHLRVKQGKGLRITFDR